MSQPRDFPDIKKGSKRPNFEIRAQADSALVLIYGDIGGWDEDSVQAGEFVRDLEALEVSEIELRINSFGGSVGDGLAIFNAIKRHPARVVAYVDGVAASMGSAIAMAGDEVRAAEASLVMVHAPWGLAIGNATELRELADTLDQFAEALVSAYAPRVGAEQAREWLSGSSDVWFTAAEALEAGLVDALDEEEIDETLAAALWTKYGGDRPPLQVAAWVRAHRGRQPGGVTVTTKTDKAPPAAAGDDDQQQAAAATAAAAAAPDVASIEAAAEARAERRLLERNREINALCDRFSDTDGVEELRAELVGSPVAEVGVDDARTRILDLLGSGAEPAGGRGAVVVSGEDARDKLRVGITAAIRMRANIETADRSNEFLGYSLLELCRACLRAGNITPRRNDKNSVVAAGFTHTASDFPNILENIAEKEMLRGWEESAETFPQWTRSGNLPDFKRATRVDLNLFPTLLKVPRGGEYQYGTIGDRGEPIMLATFGRIVGIDRQTIIDDDLDAFTRIPRKAGRAGSRTVGNLALAVLTGNELMSDGETLFHATHNNIAADAGPPTTGRVDAMRAQMALQQDPEGEADGGLNIRPRFLLTPVVLRGAAAVVLESEVEVTGEAATERSATVPNSVRGIATVLDDARLDTASATAWYMLADPNEFDTIEVAYLDGVDTPFLDQTEGWNVDGVQWKARIDAGVKALDWRTMVYNAGA